jgi:hypothetical protein
MKPHPLVIAALDETGLPWTVDQDGGHLKIRLAGRLVGVMSAGSKDDERGRAFMNVIAQIRRAAREM